MKKYMLLFLIALATLQPVFADSFVVGTVEAQRGHQSSGYLDVPPRIDEGTMIPITVAHGNGDGPTLALIAGTHGYEYPGITALQRIRKSLDPGEFSGTIIIVHIANVPSFLGRTIYYSPADGKNLNRVYPGDPEGSLSQRIAHTITQEVIEKADYLIDLHAGDGNESLRPYVYMPLTGEAELDAATKGLAMAFGLDHIVIDEAPLRSIDDSLYTDQTALVRGIPAITTETGQMGSNDDYWAKMAEAGIWNVLRHLEMIPGAEKNQRGHYLANRLPGYSQPPRRYISGRSQRWLYHIEGWQAGRSCGFLRRRNSGNSGAVLWCRQLCDWNAASQRRRAHSDDQPNSVGLDQEFVSWHRGAKALFRIDPAEYWSK